jgi:hypothetical protein
MAAGEQGTWPGRDHCQEKHQEGDVILASHENAGLEALHFHGEAKQLKIRLPFALSELPEQS